MAQYGKLPIKAFRKRFGTSGSKSFRRVERHTLNLLQGFVLTFCWLDGLSNIIERHFFSSETCCSQARIIRSIADPKSPTWLLRSVLLSAPRVPTSPRLSSLPRRESDQVWPYQ